MWYGKRYFVRMQPRTWPIYIITAPTPTPTPPPPPHKQVNHYENTPIQTYRKFHLPKSEIFQIKKSDIFHISTQNIDGIRVRTASAREIRKIIYTPVNPSFTI